MSPPQFASQVRSEPAGGGRLQGLDVLRGAAIVLVLGRHLPYLDQLPGSLLGDLLRGWLRIGWAGVDLFFVLSGFLVSGLLFREHARHGRLDLKRFYIRRGLKIYPAFYLLLGLTVLGLVAAAVTGILARLVGHDSVPASVWQRLMWDALYLQNYQLGFWPHTWSLAVEEHFYLLLGGLFMLVLARRRDCVDPFRPLLLGLPVLNLLVLALRCYSLRDWDQRFSSLAYPTHLRLDTLLWGVWLSYLYHHHHPALLEFGRRYRWPLLGLALLLLSPVFWHDLETSTWLLTYGFTAIALGAMILLGLTVLQSRSCFGGMAARCSGGAARMVAAVGFYSYSIYLWHIPSGAILFLLAERLHPGRHSPAQIIGHGLGYILLSLLVGVALARLIEVPTLVLRDRWFPSLSGSMPTVPAEPRRDD